MEYDFNEILPEESRKALRETFRQLREKVFIEVFTDGENKLYDTFTADLIKGIAELTDKIEATFYPLEGKKAHQRSVTSSPTILISPDLYRISIAGAPAGEEGRTLITAILLASNRRTIFSDSESSRLDELQESRHIQVVVSPSCPYCPQQALNAISAVLLRPDLVSAEIIEMYENPDITDKYHVITVPFTIINENPIGSGLKPADVFIEELFNLSSAEKGLTPLDGDIIEADLVIIGGGPAGLTAAIYAGRSGLKTLILEEVTVGGQILITPVVENYPGFTRIAGKNMVDMMYQQALQYVTILEGEGVLDVRKTEDKFEITTNRKKYQAKGIIIASGAEHRRLDVPGEKEFSGRGISYCATCDGYFFKDGRKVIQVGGGNSAVTDALYLNSIGADVFLVHRRETLRAEMYLQKSLMDKNIPINWNTVVKEIKGDRMVSSVMVQNLKDNSIQELPAEGVFIAIGYKPKTDIAKKLGLELFDDGYIHVDRRQKTSLERVYAAGDVTGGAKQIATAVGQGTVAALSAFEDLASPYWKKNNSEIIRTSM